MPESIDEKTGKRIFHENENTLKIQDNVEKKFNTKGSFMHRDFDDDQPYDAKRAVDEDGNSLLVEKSKLSLFDVEYKLYGMNVVPVDKNTGKVLDEKQLDLLRKQLMKEWRFVDEDEEEKIGQELGYYSSKLSKC